MSTQSIERTGLIPSTGAALPTVIDRGGVQVLSIAAMRQRAELVIEAMANVLESGKDYGKIPGTDKPTLLKPGAEKLCMMFQLAPDEPTIEDIGGGDEIRYRIHVPIVAPDGRRLAVGIGEASSNEEKNRWRKPVCDEEWLDTDPSMRREKYFKSRNGDGFYKGKQIRTSPADIANTVLKMGHKRAFIHGTLLATAAGSVFNQDLEDFTKELQESILEGDEPMQKPEPKQPQRKSESGTAPTKSTTKAPAIPADAKVIVGLVESVDRPAGQKFSAIKIKGDKRAFSAWNDTGAQIIADAQQFEGTDHQVKLAYKEEAKGNRTYYNALGISVADAEPVPPAADATKPPLDPSSVSPFTSAAERQPGEDG